jgi:hypothetical protein
VCFPTLYITSPRPPLGWPCALSSPRCTCRVPYPLPVAPGALSSPILHQASRFTPTTSAAALSFSPNRRLCLWRHSAGLKLLGWSCWGLAAATCFSANPAPAPVPAPAVSSPTNRTGCIPVEVQILLLGIDHFFSCLSLAKRPRS